MTLAKRDEMTAAVFERVVSTGDLNVLTPEQRLHYVATVCDQLGLNPLTSGFQYMTFEGKLTMYAGKQTAAQLGEIWGLDVTIQYDRITDGLFVVKGIATNGKRTVEDIGAVDLTTLKGRNLENGLMKAATKAKRRAVLGFTGMGILDESEVETLTGAITVEMDPETGEIKDPPPPPPPERKRPMQPRSQQDEPLPTTQQGWQQFYDEWAAKPKVTQAALDKIIEQAGSEGFIIVTGPADEPDPEPEPAQAAKPLATVKTPEEQIDAWLTAYGHEYHQVIGLLKMPWADWEKMFGDEAVSKARVKLGLELGIDDPLGWVDDPDKAEALAADVPEAA